MRKRQTDKPKAAPTGSEALAAIRSALHGTKFIWHTLCRIIVEKTGCEYAYADKIAVEMLKAGIVVAADPIGLTGHSTFKFTDQ